MLSFLADIRPGERRAALSAFLTLFGIMGGYALLETARDALFLARIPASQLAWVYLAIAVVALCLYAIQTRATGQTNRASLSIWLLSSALITAAFWLVLASPQIWQLYLLYVWSGVFATLVVVRFWTMLGDLFTVSQAKRLFSLIGVGSILGAVGGSIIAKLITSGLDDRHLLLGSSIYFMATAIVPIALVPSPPTEKRERSLDPSAPMASLIVEPIRTTWNNPYLRRIGGIILFSTITLTLVDFVFKYVVAQNVDPSQLGEFFATTYLILNTLSLVSQLVLVGWLVRTLGVNGVLSILPMLLILGATTVVLGAGIIGALFLKGMDGLLRHSLHRTAIEVLYVPISTDLRGRVKGILDTVGQRGGQAIASLMILGVVALGQVEVVVGALIVVFAIAWIYVGRTLRRYYLNLFRETLNEVSLRSRFEFPELDLASLETLIAALNSPEDGEVLATMDILVDQGRVRLIPALILYHPSPEVVVKALEIFPDAGRDDFVPMTDRLLDHPNPDVRAATLRALSWVAPQPDSYERHLLDGSPVVRTTALVGLISYGGAQANAALDAARKIVAAGTDLEKFALARAIRYSPGAVYVPLLLGLASSTDVEIRLAVVRAMREILSPSFLPELLKMLPDRRIRSEVRATIAALGGDVLEELNRALRSYQLDQRIRRQIPRCLTQFGAGEAAGILLEHLPHEPDGAVRYQVLRSLGRLRSNYPDLQLDEGVLREALDKTLENVFELIQWRTAIQAAAIRDPSRATDVQDLILSLLEHKEILATERLFRLLALLHSGDDFQTIYRGLQSSQRKLRSSSMELLENVLKSDLRTAVIAIVDDIDDDTRVARSGYRHIAESETYVGLLRTLLQRGGAAMRSLIAHHVAELHLHELRPALEEIQSDDEGPVARSLRRAFAALDHSHEDEK